MILGKRYESREKWLDSGHNYERGINSIFSLDFKRGMRTIVKDDS